MPETSQTVLAQFFEDTVGRLHRWPAMLGAMLSSGWVVRREGEATWNQEAEGKMGPQSAPVFRCALWLGPTRLRWRGGRMIVRAVAAACAACAVCWPQLLVRG